MSRDVPRTPPRLSQAEYKSLTKKEWGYLAIAFAIVFFICLLTYVVGYGLHAFSNLIVFY